MKAELPKAIYKSSPRFINKTQKPHKQNLVGKNYERRADKKR